MGDEKKSILKGKFFWGVISIVTIVISAYAFVQSRPQSHLEQGVLSIGDAEFIVEIADTNAERAQGLQDRETLDENAGIVFIFSKTEQTAFWMKNTRIPLDMVWVTDNTVVGVQENVPTQIGQPDHELIRYPSPGPVDIGIELNAGAVEKYGIHVGDLIQIK